jgi:hypothetical protein
MGKSTIMAISNSKLLVYQRLANIVPVQGCPSGLKPSADLQQNMRIPRRFRDNWIHSGNGLDGWYIIQLALELCQKNWPSHSVEPLKSTINGNFRNLNKRYLPYIRPI